MCVFLSVTVQSSKSLFSRLFVRTEYVTGQETAITGDAAASLSLSLSVTLTHTHTHTFNLSLSYLPPSLYPSVRPSTTHTHTPSVPPGYSQWSRGWVVTVYSSQAITCFCHLFFLVVQPSSSPYCLALFFFFFFSMILLHLLVFSFF